MPVNHSVVDDAVIIRTSPYSLLGTYGRDAVLAFEVDQFDHATARLERRCRGRAEVVTRPPTSTTSVPSGRPGPGASGARTLVLRIPLSELTGRRLGHRVVDRAGLPSCGASPPEGVRRSDARGPRDGPDWAMAPLSAPARALLDAVIAISTDLDLATGPDPHRRVRGPSSPGPATARWA